MIPLDNINFSPTSSKYLALTNQHVFFGYLIKNLYDEKRIKIKPIHNPNYFILRSGIKLIHLYGIIFPVPDYYLTLFNDLYKLNTEVENKELFHEYLKTIADYQLTANDNYLRYDTNIFPIDNKHIKKLIGSSWENVSLIEYSNEIPMFQQICSDNLYLIGNSKKLKYHYYIQKN